MSNAYSLQFDEAKFENGDHVAFSFRINRQLLAELAWRAARTKSGKSKLLKGALIIESKRMPCDPKS